MNADKSRSVISTIVNQSRIKGPTRQERKTSYLHDYQKEHQVALSSAQTQEREARKSRFNMSDDDDGDIDDMDQTLTWIGFNAIASRDTLQIDIEKFEDMLELTGKDISDLEYSYSKRTAADGSLILVPKIPSVSSQ